MRIKKLATKIISILVMLTLLLPVGFSTNVMTAQATNTQAFDSLHNQLLSTNAIDITSEIQAMETIFAAEGLSTQKE